MAAAVVEVGGLDPEAAGSAALGLELLGVPVGASARSSTEVSAALLVTRVGGTIVSGAGALLELEFPAVARELPAVASISKSSSGSGVALFLFGVAVSGCDPEAAGSAALGLELLAVESL